MRSAFLKQKRFLRFYDRNELIAHEVAHAGRMMFNEPKFEEILAYRSSSSRFLKTFGPILESSLESVLFMAILFFIFLLDLLFILYAPYASYIRIQWLKLIPLALVGYAFIRLYRKQKIFQRALGRLRELLPNKNKADPFIYRLTDEEIVLFSKMTAGEIHAYALAQREDSLRWRILCSSLLAT